MGEEENGRKIKEEEEKGEGENRGRIKGKWEKRRIGEV